MTQTDRQSGASADLARDAEALRPSLSRFFRRRVDDAAEVEDLVQEVFLRLADKGGFSDSEHLGAYVFRTAASVMTDHRRRRAARRQDRHVVFDPDLHGGAAPDASQILAGRQTLQAVIVALEALPERTREVFVLKRLDGLRQKDIAQRFGISVSAVEKHLTRAMQHLMAQTEAQR